MKVYKATSIGKYRWRIVALLFLATTINYIDRNVISFIMLNDDFKRDIMGLAPGSPITNEVSYQFISLMGKVDSAMKGAYALGFILMGWVIDKFGSRLGYASAIVIWVTSAISTAFVSSVSGLKIARAGLGLGEGGHFPAAIKTVAEWFPKKERSFATGTFNAGANIGIIITAMAVMPLSLQYGWRTTFIITSSLGLILLLLWLITYRKPEQHSGVSQQELNYIKSDTVDEVHQKISWFKLLPYRQTWAFALGKFFTDCIWWFYIFLLPTFFRDTAVFDINLKQIGLPFLVIYLVSDGGSVLFGWLSSLMIKSGWSVNRARKTTMLVCALCVVPIFFATITQNLVIAIGLISIAAAAHQGWSANLFTTVSDMFPKYAVSSVTGIGGFMGAMGGMILPAFYGDIIGPEKNYLPLFLLASSAYLFALAVIHFLVPKLEPVKFKEQKAAEIIEV